MADIECWSPFKSWLYSLINRNPKSNRAVVELLELGPNDRLLDIGCGPGAALADAVHTGASVAGVDPSPSMVARAQARTPVADVKVGSAEDIPFPDGQFTAVINISSFHHWADREAGLVEARRVLAPGGRLLVVEAKLKAGSDGHGLSPSAAESLAAKLAELGYVDTRIDEIKPGWRFVYYVVTGVAPAE